MPIIHTDEPQRKYSRDNEDPYRLKGIASHSPGMTPGAATYDDDQSRYMANPQSYSAQSQDQSFFLPGQQHLSQQPASAYQQAQPTQSAQPTYDSPVQHERNQSSYGDWIAPAAIGAGAGTAGAAAYNHYNNDDKSELQRQAATEAALVDDGGLQQQAAAESALVDDGGLQQQATREAALVDDGGAPTAAAISNIPSATENTPLANDRDLTSVPAVVPAVVPTSDSTPAPITSPPTATETSPNATYLSYPSNTGSGIAGSSAIPVSAMDGGLGGLESRGAHETGHIFPSVVRHNTDISISQLHVPGEFPKKE